MKKKIIIVSGILTLTVLLIALGFSILNDSYNSNGISFIENTKSLQNYQIKLDISIDEETSVGATFDIHANTQDVALTLTRQGCHSHRIIY